MADSRADLEYMALLVGPAEFMAAALREVERLQAERDAAQAAIQRVRPAVREALRLLDDWQTAEELGTVEEWAVQISETLRALIGDTKEGR